MPYSADVIQRARKQLADQKAEKESRYRQNLQQAYARIPRLQQIDIQLRNSMAKAARLAFEKGGDPQAMDRVRQENQALQAQYRDLVAENFAPGFLEDTPVCSRCGGTGYLGSTMCDCLRRLCRQEQREQIAALTNGAERFEAFRLEYYPEQIDRNIGISPRLLMQKNLEACRQYARDFCPGIGNLLFVGGTGLGKTFLSACIANEVTDKGYSVAYESAPQLFMKLEKNRFNPDEQSQRQADTFSQVDLLIIDDLGTEMSGSFVTAALYALLNERLLSGKSMIISTNLTITEAAQRYSHQIASRLQGSFRGVTFVGEDIRLLKSRGVRY